ncbi:MAG: hypothetical protein PHY02_10815 [Phycisphaerae bacterium]|nr:hypothetical protein [Phycisphaerae bacterium]
MLYYKDMTYCPYWRTCEKGRECSRALTETVEDCADEFGLPIDRFNEQPPCYKESKREVEPK